MPAADLIRYGLWLGVAATARANRRQYGMPTTWVPHLVLNTVALMLPELYALATRAAHGRPASGVRAVAAQAVESLVQDAGQYVVCVAPFTAGYLLSNPHFDIYKGELGELRMAGFGLDAIPHCATATGVCLLIADALPAAAAAAPATPFGNLLRRAAQNPLRASGVVLAALTAFWETGEYMAYRYEIGVQGEAGRINMVWSPVDTLRDCLANALGWSIACLIGGRRV